MFEKRCSARVFTLLGSLAVYAGMAHAAVLYTSSITILSTDPTQLGRLSRDGITADWSFQKPFPGVINPTTTYHYEAISILVPSWLDYLQISIDSNNANIFASVYDTSYHPTGVLPNLGLDVHYMGDAGGSGNFFGNPLFFQVVDQTAANATTGFGTIILVLNETTANGGLNSPVGVLVEGFSDTGYDEVPEPLTAGLLGSGMLLLLAAYRRRDLSR